MTCIKCSRRGGHKLQVQVAERSEVPRRKAKKVKEARASPEVQTDVPSRGVETRGRKQKQQTPPKDRRAYLIAQLKLDGDRLQAHVLDADTVRLFTRNGYDVSDVYSDVCNELREARLKSPCIFDGELIVVNAAGLPLPWESAKWRFNGFYARVDAAVGATAETVMMPDYEEAEANCHNVNADDEEPVEGLAFVPVNSRWATQHTCRPVPVACHLRYVIFDMLMWNGEELSANSCALRHRRLSEALDRPFKNTRFVSLMKVRYTQSVLLWGVEWSFD